MNPLIPAITFFAMVGPPLQSQEKAVTSSGKKIIIFQNGTWKNEQDVIKTPATQMLSRPETSTAKASILKGRASIYYNPTKWKPKGNEEGGRTTFLHVDGDAQAMIIAERIQMPIEALEKMALSNAKAAAPDASIVLREVRHVNNLEILMLQVKGKIDGTPFIYYNYYYSGEKGVIQAITFTAQNLFTEYKSDFEDFLNGLSLEP